MIFQCHESGAREQYERMRRDGIPEAEFDQGHQRVRANPDGTAGIEVVGKGDGGTDCEELKEVSARHADRYGDYLRLLTGRQVPWLYDDGDPQTDSDQKIDALADRAIAALQKRLGEMGLAPSSDTYRRDLGISLYHFARLARGGRSDGQVEGTTRERYRRYGLFEEWGLRPFQDFLFREGGLGLAWFTGNAKLEATAIEAIEQRKGLCTERSKGLYRLFEKGGLNPVYVRMSAKQAHEAWIREFSENVPAAVTPEDYILGHVAVAIPLSDGLYYFEPNQNAHGRFFEGLAMPITPREMYQFDLHNLVIDLMNQRNFDEAERFLRGAFALGESVVTPFLFAKRGDLLLERGDPQGALDHWRKAREADPTSVRPLLQTCDLQARLERWEAARQCLGLLPDDSTHKAVWLARHEAREGRLAEARRLWEKAVELGHNREEAYLEISNLFLEEKDLRQAEEYARRVIRINPRNLEAYLRLAAALQGQGREAELLEPLRQAISLEDHPAIYHAISGSLLTVGRVEEAREYFRRALLFAEKLDHFPYETYGVWRYLAEKLDLWPEVAKARFSSRAVGAFTVRLFQLEARARSEKKPAGFYRDEFRGLLREAGASQGIPASIYWPFLSIAERCGEIGTMIELCQNTNHPRFFVYALHVEWQSGQKKVVQEGLNRWNGTLDSWSRAQPSERNPDLLAEVGGAIDELPATMLKFPAYRKLFARYYRLLSETYAAANRMPESAAALQRAEALTRQ